MLKKAKQGRKIIKRIILIISLFVIITVFIGLEQHYVMGRLDTHQRRVEGFYLEEKNSLDMVILGSSEIYNGYVPAKAWENDGITSYIYGFKSNPATLWPYQLKEIERTQNPDLVVVEANGAIYDEETLNDPSEIRFMTDDMPLCRNKIDLINEKGTEGKLSYYFPFLKYHAHLIPGDGTKSRMLLEQRGYNITRGNQARVDGEDVSDKAIDVEGDDSVAPLDPAAEKALRSFLEQCQESEIKNIVFVRFPHVTAKKNYIRFQRYHRIKEIVEEYGFEYIDFDDYREEMDLTVQGDFVDLEHLNATGAQKLTAFMVPMLMEKYNVTPRQQSAQSQKEWQESVAYYDKMYEYWQYYIEAQPDHTSDKYDMTDSAYSNDAINAYFAGHPIDPADDKGDFLSRMKKKVKEIL